MARRIIWGFILGFAFLALLLQSAPYVLFCLGVVHAVAQFEYCSLMPELSLRRLVLHLFISTAVWLSLSLALAGLADGKLAICVDRKKPHPGVGATSFWSGNS